MDRRRIALAFAACAVLFSAGPMAWRATARSEAVKPATLEGLANGPIAEWVPTEAAGPIVDAAPLDAEGRPVDVYDHIVYRSYQRADGTMITLVLAYLNQQELRAGVHRPEGCYTSLGYVTDRATTKAIESGDRRIAVRSFVATGASRQEAVVYWIRVGQTTSRSALAGRIEALRATFSHRQPDALLVRASIARSRDGGAIPAGAAAVLARFLSEFVASVPAAERPILIG